MLPVGVTAAFDIADKKFIPLSGNGKCGK